MILIDDYFDFINTLNINKFRTKLKAANKLKAFGEQDRIKTSAIYHWFGNHKHALKVLKNSSSSLAELEFMTKNQIIEYIRETHQLNFLGAYGVAKKRYTYLESRGYFKKIEKIYPQAYNSLGNHFLQTFQFERAFNCFNKYEKILTKESSAWFFNILSQADSLAGLEQFDAALELTFKLETFSKTNPIYGSIFHQVIGDFLLRSNKNEEALKYLLESEAIFKANKINNKDFAYCQISLAVYYFKNGEISKAKTYLKKAKSLLKGPNNSIYSLKQLSYLFKKFDVKDFSLELLGSFFPISSTSSYSSILNLEKQDATNTTLVRNGNITKINNKNKMKFTQLPILNLSENRLELEEKTDILTKQQSSFLKLLIATNTNGCFEAILLEKLYPDSVYNQLEKDKLKKLARRLKDKGFDIVVKDRFYFLRNLGDYSILLKS